MNLFEHIWGILSIHIFNYVYVYIRIDILFFSIRYSQFGLHLTGLPETSNFQVFPGGKGGQRETAHNSLKATLPLKERLPSLAPRR